ncbi:MAG: 6-phosphofructokinase [Firmicutes bacterium]|nr:6-phosphofructokinase [Bacillota bacterium]
MKKIGVLTSGGDAPGMNAAIRAVARAGYHYGVKVYGIERGYQGLLDEQILGIDQRSVSNVLQRGGTMLRSARCLAFKQPEVRAKAVKILKKHGIEGLIVIGGDGSFMGAKLLSELGVPTVGIPGTIDNDLAYTDYTLGFDTACNTILDAINKVRDTMDSHERVNIMEVMGRDCGDLALHAGLAGGAQAIVVPEQPMTPKQVLAKIMEGKASGKRSSIVVLSEGAGKAESLAKEIASMEPALDVRSTVLGHIQRGGAPSMLDRRLGTLFGEHAVKLLTQGIGNRIVGIKDNKIFDVDIVEGLSIKRHFDKEMYDIANMMAK